jgi:hypothetical protein
VTATDGAVITVERDDQSSGWKLVCSVCGYVMSDSGQDDSEVFVREEAEHHVGWHDAEYAKAGARR